jgi:hypothetical protein
LIPDGGFVFTKLKAIVPVTVMLLGFAHACSPAYAPGPTPLAEVEEAGEVNDTPGVQESLPTPTPEAVEPPTPVDTPTALPPTPKNEGFVEENRILFPPGGTWVEVNGTLEEGASRTFVLAAMQDQVMSLSVRQGWPFTVAVADGARTLTDPNYEQPFWRGTLPATGDYFVTLNSDTAGAYTLRVAINPPGQARQYFDYIDTVHASSFRYSDEFAPTLYSPAGGYGGRFMLTLIFINMDFLTPVTNLSEAYFIYSAVDDEESVTICTEPLSPQESLLGQEVINGYEFTKSEMFGAGAGNIYHQVIYRTVIENVCYEMVLNMHSGNIGNYPPGQVKEFDQAALLAKFEAIIASFNVQ